MTTDRAKLIAKVRALFALSTNNPSAEEAQAALLKARELMQQYQLDEADVGDPTGSSPTGAYDVKLGSTTIASWKRMLGLVIADYFDVRSIVGRGIDPSRQSKMGFCGHALNAEIAAHAYASLMIQIDLLARDYRVGPELAEQNVLEGWFGSVSAYCRAAKREYREGLVVGLDRVLEQRKRAEEQAAHAAELDALALRHEDLQQQWLDEHMPDLKTAPKPSEPQGTLDGHVDRGYRDADLLELRRGLQEEHEDA